MANAYFIKKDPNTNQEIVITDINEIQSILEKSSKVESYNVTEEKIDLKFKDPVENIGNKMIWDELEFKFKKDITNEVVLER